MLLILMMGNSCKTYKSLERIEPRTDSASLSEQLQKLKPGDLIQVFEKRGGIKVLEFVITEEGVLRGFEPKGPKDDLISIKLEDIAKVEVKKINAGKTLLVTGAVVASIYLVFFVIMLATLVEPL
ncbi:hypothetical protein M3O96_21005 [Aquiflexum sp. TKW24L]|uniref:hypothetical protein n=1 Tax=Aquiflexum sp. TKW24L TaxID=2942212 RepID=UPI0020BFEC0E|nr:hypothetical protein [Aquiflexum sp. TKW24L]MCL6261592.1 hypothetical protein [Aquiflexum sp. TKW24L]